MDKPQLGDRVKDRITGFSGIVVGRTEWLSGCGRVGIQAEKSKAGVLPPEPFWVDDQQVAILGRKAFSVKPTRGGPMSDPRRSADPRA